MMCMGLPSPSFKDKETEEGHGRHSLDQVPRTVRIHGQPLRPPSLSLPGFLEKKKYRGKTLRERTASCYHRPHPHDPPRREQDTLSLGSGLLAIPHIERKNKRMDTACIGQ